MIDSKLIQMLKTFSTAEFRRFGEFLASPYHNKQADLVQLYAYLLKQAPAFRPKKLERDAVWKAVFPKKAFDDRRLAYLMSDLVTLGEQFVGLEYYRRRAPLPEIHTLSACEDRLLEKHFLQNERRLIKANHDFPYRNEDFYYHNYLMSGASVRFLHRKGVRAYDKGLQEMVNHLDDYYLITKLRLTCELINRQSILSGTYDINLVDELLAYLRNYKVDMIPAMAIYFQILRILTEEEDDRHFHDLKQLMEAHLHRFPDREKQSLFSYAQNYCIRRVRKGEPRYLQELFELYQGAIADEILLEDGLLSPWKYKNIASVGLRVRAFDWVREFIQAYRDRLQGDFAESAVAFNQANLHYHLGEYAQALRQLMTVAFTDPFYALDTRKMMVMIYFEQGEEEALLSLLAAFRVFLRRNKLVSEGNRAAYTNFLNLVQALYRGAADKELIRSTQPLVEEDWLLQRLKSPFSTRLPLRH